MIEVIYLGLVYKLIFEGALGKGKQLWINYISEILGYEVKI